MCDCGRTHTHTHTHTHTLSVCGYKRGFTQTYPHTMEQRGSPWGTDGAPWRHTDNVCIRNYPRVSAECTTHCVTDCLTRAPAELSWSSVCGSPDGRIASFMPPPPDSKRMCPFAFWDHLPEPPLSLSETQPTDKPCSHRTSPLHVARGATMETLSHSGQITTIAVIAEGIPDASRGAAGMVRRFRICSVLPGFVVKRRAQLWLNKPTAAAASCFCVINCVASDSAPQLYSESAPQHGDTIPTPCV